MTKIGGPETSTIAPTWSVRAIDMTKKSWSPDFPYSLYMAFTIYIYDEKVGPETFPRAFTWLVRPIYFFYIYILAIRIQNSIS
jgi:hypothetical protein